MKKEILDELKKERERNEQTIKRFSDMVERSRHNIKKYNDKITYMENENYYIDKLVAASIDKTNDEENFEV